MQNIIQNHSKHVTPANGPCMVIKTGTYDHERFVNCCRSSCFFVVAVENFLSTQHPMAADAIFEWKCSNRRHSNENKYLDFAGEKKKVKCQKKNGKHIEVENLNLRKQFSSIFPISIDPLNFLQLTFVMHRHNLSHEDIYSM